MRQGWSGIPAKSASLQPLRRGFGALAKTQSLRGCACAEAVWRDNPVLCSRPNPQAISTKATKYKIKKPNY